MGIETRVIVISPDSAVTPEKIKSKILLLVGEDTEEDMDIIVKDTCYGVLVEGEEEKVRKIVEEVRKLDKNGIFSKPRGFPIGDPRICRATRKGGPRPGFHQLELEYSLLPKVREALDKLEKGEGNE
ncbi:MAG: methanogenesis marker 6 protein [Candidatus Methanospirareceae archaeon]